MRLELDEIYIVAQDRIVAAFDGLIKNKSAFAWILVPRVRIFYGGRYCSKDRTKTFELIFKI